jgi:hypothetical protein
MRIVHLKKLYMFKKCSPITFIPEFSWADLGTSENIAALLLLFFCVFLWRGYYLGRWGGVIGSGRPGDGFPRV